MQHFLFRELRSVLVLLFFFSTLSGALAQGIAVQGKVTDESGGGLPGVTVLVKGTSSGTATGADGSYSLQAPGNGTLIFSFIGFQTKEVAINNKTTIDVQLSADAKAL